MLRYFVLGLRLLLSLVMSSWCRLALRHISILVEVPLIIVVTGMALFSVWCRL
jgi:hypothetical protein